MLLHQNEQTFQATAKMVMARSGFRMANTKSYSENRNGQLGDGTITDQSYPEMIACPQSLNRAYFVNTQIEMFPNPTTGSINLENLSESASYELYNTLGQLIISGNLSGGKSITIDSANGLYFLKIIDRGTTTARKVVLKNN